MQNIKNCGDMFFLQEQKGVWSCIKAVGNHIGVVVLVDGMDKLHDVMGGVGEVGDWRVSVQTHSMELITVLHGYFSE